MMIFQLYPVQTLPVNITPVGILIAIVFLSALLFTFHWMLRIRGSVSHQLTPEEREFIRRKGPILLAVSPSFLNYTTVQIAASLAKERKVPMMILCVLEVPFLLPPGVYPPEMEKQARKVLQEAWAFAKEMGVQAETKLISARAASKAIINEADEFGASTIVMGGREKRWEGVWLGSTAQHVLQGSRAEVIIDRL